MIRKRLICCQYNYQIISSFSQFTLQIPFRIAISNNLQYKKPSSIVLKLSTIKHMDMSKT